VRRGVPRPPSQVHRPDPPLAPREGEDGRARRGTWDGGRGTNPPSRREFLASSAAAALGAHPLFAQEPGERPRRAEGVRVLNPRTRVPVSLIIDDSTCLVNLAHYCIPQFAEVFPDRYQQDWKSLPREIPDSFVRKFAEWSREHGVKGKYSVIPYPALVGRIDQALPGWSKADLEASLKVLRDVMAPDWDFHPEMVTHTRIVDPRTGKPCEEKSERFMENWGWCKGRSADELTDYLAFALRILKNVGLKCEGVTSPGGFGTGALPEYARAVLQSCRDVFGAEVPHYVKHAGNDPSVAPRVHYAAGLDGDSPRCAVQIVAGTGDWFGGWDGLTPGSVDKFITADFKQGRMADVIRRGEPAIMLGHWPGFYTNGQELGFDIFKEIVKRLKEGFDHLVWMKLSEIARYWAARELTHIDRAEGTISFSAPFACPAFTVELAAREARFVALKEVPDPLRLTSGTWTRQGEKAIVCVDLPRGASRLELK
jgi:hypothetical protein